MDWSVFKGSRGCHGAYRLKPTWAFAQLDGDNPLKRTGSFLLNGSCRSILTYDRHIFAVSSTDTDGSIVVAPLMEMEDLQAYCWSLNLRAPVRARAVIHRGSLYVAAGSRLFAFTLSDVGGAALQLRWSFDFRASVPVSVLLPIDDSLYVPVAHDPQYQRGCMIRLDNISSATQPRAVVLHDGLMPSPAAAMESEPRSVFFLAADTVRLYCGMVSHQDGREPALAWRPVNNAFSPMDPVHPIAVHYGKIFSIFRQDQTLCRIDIQTAQVDDAIVRNARRFSLSTSGSPLVVTAANVMIPARRLAEDLLPGHIVHSHPLLLGDVAAVMGLGDGDVRIFDMANLARFRVWRVPGAGAPVTHLAPYGDILVIGDAFGAITVTEFNVSPPEAS
jgi:hypothetical protein